MQITYYYKYYSSFFGYGTVSGLINEFNAIATNNMIKKV